MHLPRDIFIRAAAAVTGYGLDGTSLAAQLRSGPAETTVPIAESEDAADGRQRKLMSQAARLAVIAMRRALAQAGLGTDLHEVGAYFGVGASGGTLNELSSLTAESRCEDRFDLRRFGEHGLQTCNPLLAFRLMNNFSLCHGSILSGLGGPNGAYFSRGGGTVTAIAEAAWALCDGECEHAITGGSDCAHSALTLAELRRSGAIELGVVPAEAAAAIVLSLAPSAALSRLVLLAQIPASPGDDDHTLAALIPAAPAPEAKQLEAALVALSTHDIDAAVFCGWSRSARDCLRDALAKKFAHAECIDLSSQLGETLAAGPAVALAAAVDLIAHEQRHRVAVLSASIDGELSVLCVEAP